MHCIVRRSGQRVALPVCRTREWRRRLSHSVPRRAAAGRQTHLLSGNADWTVFQPRQHQRVRCGAADARHRIRPVVCGRRTAVLLRGIVGADRSVFCGLVQFGVAVERMPVRMGTDVHRFDHQEHIGGDDQG